MEGGWPEFPEVDHTSSTREVRPKLRSIWPSTSSPQPETCQRSPLPKPRTLNSQPYTQIGHRQGDESVRLVFCLVYGVSVRVQQKRCVQGLSSVFSVSISSAFSVSVYQLRSVLQSSGLIKCVQCFLRRTCRSARSKCAKSLSSPFLNPQPSRMRPSPADL